MNEVFAIRGRVVTASRIITDGAVVVSGDAIVWIGESTAAKEAGFGDEILAATAPSDTEVAGFHSPMRKLKTRRWRQWLNIYAGELLLW